MKFKRGKAVGFKVGVFGGGTGNSWKKPATNACVFRTWREADLAGRELLWRWLQPDNYRVIEQTREPPNYVFEDGSPRPMTQEELEDVALAIAKHNTNPLVFRDTQPPRPNPTTITEADYRGASNDHLGWCIECKDWTHDCAEPDAERYECPRCGERAVFGAEQARLVGLITIG